MTYGTKCKTCNTSSERVEDFHELEVNLTVRWLFMSGRTARLELTYRLERHSVTASWKTASAKV